MFSRKQRKKIRSVVLIALVIFIVMISSYMVYQWITYRKAKFTRYPEFGITIPEKYSIHGIDVSRFQEMIAWEEVQAMQVNDIRLGFVFIKATEGIGNIDPNFKRNWKKSKSSGMIRGAYHFFIGSKDGRMQAENFIKQVDLEDGDLPPVLDIEQLGSTPVIIFQKEVKEWLDIVAAHYGVTPIIYTNVDFYKRNLGDAFDTYPLWVAHYYEPRQPRITREWLFWQHSDEGHVNGIISKVDFNVFSGDSTQFRALLIHKNEY